MEAASRTLAMALTETKSSVRWKIFLMMLMLVSISYVNHASPSVAMPLVAKKFSIDSAMQSLLLSSFFPTCALMQAPGDMLAGRFGPRVMVTGATLGWGFFQSIAALCIGWVPLLVMCLGLGTVEAPIYPAEGKFNAVWMTQNEHGRGTTLFDRDAPLDAALGVLITAGLIAELNSWHTSFVVAGIGTMVTGLFAWWYIRNHPREHPSVNNAGTSYTKETHAADRAAEPVTLSDDVLNFLKYHSMWDMFFDWTCFDVLFYGLLTRMLTRLSKAHGLDIEEMGGTIFAVFFSGLMGEMVGEWIVDGWMATGTSCTHMLHTPFGIASVLATIAIRTVTHFKDPIVAVALLSTALFFLCWHGLFWYIPSILGTHRRVSFSGGTMNLGGNFTGIGMLIAIGLIIQVTDSYDMALMLLAAAGTDLFIRLTLLINYSKKLSV